MAYLTKFTLEDDGETLVYESEDLHFFNSYDELSEEIRAGIKDKTHEVIELDDEIIETGYLRYYGTPDELPKSVLSKFVSGGAMTTEELSELKVALSPTHHFSLDNPSPYVTNELAQRRLQAFIKPFFKDETPNNPPMCYVYNIRLSCAAAIAYERIARNLKPTRASDLLCLADQFCRLAEYHDAQGYNHKSMYSSLEAAEKRLKELSCHFDKLTAQQFQKNPAYYFNEHMGNNLEQIRSLFRYSLKERELSIPKNSKQSPTYTSLTTYIEPYIRHFKFHNLVEEIKYKIKLNTDRTEGFCLQDIHDVYLWLTALYIYLQAAQKSHDKYQQSRNKKQVGSTFKVYQTDLNLVCSTLRTLEASYFSDFSQKLNNTYKTNHAQNAGQVRNTKYEPYKKHLKELLVSERPPQGWKSCSHAAKMLAPIIQTFQKNRGENLISIAGDNIERRAYSWILNTPELRALISKAEPLNKKSNNT